MHFYLRHQNVDRSLCIFFLPMTFPQNETLNVMTLKIEVGKLKLLSYYRYGQRKTKHGNGELNFFCNLIWSIYHHQVRCKLWIIIWKKHLFVSFQGFRDVALWQVYGGHHFVRVRHVFWVVAINLTFVFHTGGEKAKCFL